jgi:hypothetical protein
MAEWRKLETDLTAQNQALRRQVEELEYKLTATANIAIERERELEAAVSAQQQALTQLHSQLITESATSADKIATLESQLTDASAERDIVVSSLTRRADALSARAAGLLDEKLRFEARLEAAGVDVVAAAPMPPRHDGSAWSAAQGHARAGPSTEEYAAHSSVRLRPLPTYLFMTLSFTTLRSHPSFLFPVPLSVT